MPEGVMPYPKWDGKLSSGDQWRVVAGNEIRAALRTNWGLFSVLAGIGWGIASAIEIAQGRSSFDTEILQSAMEDMLSQLRWFAMAVAAAVAAPSLLRDHHSGALELYMSRSLSRRGYLLGKAVAAIGLVGVTMLVPLLLYYLSGLLFYDSWPENWHTNVALAVVYILQWALLVAGLGLGLSCISRSARGAVLLFLGIFAGMDLVVKELLASLTENSDLAIVSPFAAHHQHIVWFFQAEAPHTFPPLWGLYGWLGLTALGWALYAWKHPRVRGEENA